MKPEHWQQAVELARILLEFEIEQQQAAAADETLARDAATTARSQSTAADRPKQSTPGRPALQARRGQ